MKQTIKDFMSIQKTFFVGVAMDYFQPILQLCMVVVRFLQVLFELPKQLLLCVIMDNDEYASIQENKFISEFKEGRDLDMFEMEEEVEEVK